MKFRSPFLIFFIVWGALVIGVFFVWNKWTPIELLLGWQILIALNAATFVLFGLDKFFAGASATRIPEKILYLATFVGGSLGALAAMNFFRHKTRKLSFQLVMALLVLLQVGIVWLFYNNNILYNIK